MDPNDPPALSSAVSSVGFLKFVDFTCVAPHSLDVHYLLVHGKYDPLRLHACRDQIYTGRFVHNNRSKTTLIIQQAIVDAIRNAPIAIIGVDRFISVETPVSLVFFRPEVRLSSAIKSVGLTWHLTPPATRRAVSHRLETERIAAIDALMAPSWSDIADRTSDDDFTT
jgi:hypothetical protein